MGLSPPVRGNPSGVGGVARIGRSIPACAGEPSIIAPSRYVIRVYPRLCGGTESRNSYPFIQQGLSPPVRGNRIRWHNWGEQGGSIPACAGEPDVTLPGRIKTRVYPRLCGGTRCDLTRAHQDKGLSPPVRGNPPTSRPRRGIIRSIPACAGEPVDFNIGLEGSKVYPRLCGGTRKGHDFRVYIRGLSPPVRGNRVRFVCSGIFVGSIPACAGEPVFIGQTSGQHEVYPRLCGGTLERIFLVTQEMGLSPPVRGTGWWYAAAAAIGGLSPPVRGNLAAYISCRSQLGSIPACAGETETQFNLGLAIRGLSPPVRGNLIPGREILGRRGSIPACAGEPL